MEFDYPTHYPYWWDFWVKKFARIQARYFEALIRHTTKEGKNPIYIVRYEDLCTHPTEELTGMMKFLLDMDDISGTNVERRIA